MNRWGRTEYLPPQLLIIKERGQIVFLCKYSPLRVYILYYKVVLFFATIDSFCSVDVLKEGTLVSCDL
jgi:hypothetical protein